MNSDDDKCSMDDVMASCQHIRFIEEKIESGESVEINHYQQVPPGTHYLFGAKVVNTSSLVETM